MRDGKTWTSSWTGVFDEEDLRILNHMQRCVEAGQPVTLSAAEAETLLGTIEIMADSIDMSAEAAMGEDL